MIQAYPADALVDSIGVVTALTYTNTPYYQQWPCVFAALEALGVRHIRDQIGDPAKHQMLKAAGIGVHCVVPYDASLTTAELQARAIDAGNVESLEAPNETDAAGGDIQRALAMLPVIHAAGQALKVPVIGPSFVKCQSYAATGNLDPIIDANNVHVYMGGRNPGNSGWAATVLNGARNGCLYFWEYAARQNSSRPVWITETGYITGTAPYRVPEDVAAKYAVRMALLAWKRRFRRTFFYALLDNSHDAYGLLDVNLMPRRHYAALQQLIYALSDPGPAFTCGSLNYSVSAATAPQSILLQKRDGSFYLILWLEASAWDVVNCVYTPVPMEQATLTLDSGSRSIVLSDAPLILKIQNGVVVGQERIGA